MLEPERLSGKSTLGIGRPEESIARQHRVSWEVTIKISGGKLRVPGSDVGLLSNNLAAFGIGVLPILPAHLGALQRLPHYHRDPFDRLLIAQAQTEAVALATGDAQIARYPVDVLW